MLSPLLTLALPLALPLGLACSPKTTDTAVDNDPPFGTELARIEMPPASSLWVDTARAFACAGSDGLYVLDVSAPTAPMLEDIVEIECLAVDGESGGVYVATGTTGLRVVHPGDLALIGSYETDFPVNALTVDSGESQAWVAGQVQDTDTLGVDGVVTYSVSNLSQNKRADLEPGDAAAIAYDRAGVFVARTDGVIDVIGLTMQLQSQITLDAPLAGSSGAGLLAHNEVLWAAQGTLGLVGWDVNSLTKVQQLAAWTADSAWGLAAVEDRLYVGVDQALLVLDISDPSAPFEVGRVALDGIARPEGVYILDNKAWITDGQDGAFSVASIDESQNG